MALARVQYTADGSTDTFSVTFPYLKKGDVKVSVNGTVVTEFTWPTTSAVKLATTPGSGDVVDIVRETEREEILVDFQDGSTLLESDLDLSARQSFYLAQESFDQTGSTLAVANDGSYSANTRRISSLGYPEAPSDAATQQHVADIFAQGEDAFEQATIATDAADVAVSARDAAELAESTTLGYRDTAKQHKDNAAASASAASTSESNAATSESNAATSELNAANSADEAEGYAAGLNLPSATGNGEKILRQKTDETGFEYIEEPYSQSQANATFADKTSVTPQNFASMPNVNGDPIVESGSNSDGEWTRWANGTQVCTYLDGYGFTYQADASSGIDYGYVSSDQQIALPVSFIDSNYSVSIESGRGGGRVVFAQLDIGANGDGITPTYFHFTIVNGRSEGSVGYSLNYTAHGFWK